MRLFLNVLSVTVYSGLLNCVRGYFFTIISGVLPRYSNSLQEQHFERPAVVYSLVFSRL